MGRFYFIDTRTTQAGGGRKAPPVLAHKAGLHVQGVKGVIPIEKTFMGRRFNPDRYEMMYCPICKGSGKIINGLAGRVVCKVCGGFGLVKKHKIGLEEGVRT